MGDYVVWRDIRIGSSPFNIALNHLLGRAQSLAINAEGKDPCHCSQCFKLRITSTAKRPNPALALLFPANPIGPRVPRLCPTILYAYQAVIARTAVTNTMHTTAYPM